MRIALRTQQVIAYESGVTNTIDPLGGSYFVEALTSKMEKEALDYIRKIDRMGGMIPAIRNGYPQMEIANASHRYQNQVERSVKIIVGVNDFVLENEPPIEILKIDSAAIEERQRQSLKELKSVRNVELVQKSLDALRQAALNDQNIMPALLDSARAYATVGEMADVLRKVYGEYHDPGIY